MTPALVLSEECVRHTECCFAVVLVAPSLVIKISLALGLLVNDSSCVHRELTLTSAGATACDPISLSLLVSGRGWTGSLGP